VENLVLLAIRLFWLALLAASYHFQSGLAYPTLALSALIGWRAWRAWWLAPLVVAPAIYASHFYADATGSGKLPGAMSNVLFQCGVFALLALTGFAVGWAVRRKV
jgi:hypothetical protein